MVLRLILLIETALLPLIGIHLERAAAYDVSVWGSITISIFVAELFIVQRSIRAVLPASLDHSVPQPAPDASGRRDPSSTAQSTSR